MSAIRPARRWLVYELVRREVSQRYAGSVSGIAWTFLQPLAQLAIFAFVFSRVFRATVPPEFPQASYMTFVAVALWPWVMFSEAIQRGMGAISANAGLIRKVAVPSEVFVYSNVVACALVQLVGFIAVLLVLRASGEPIHLSGIPSAVALLVPYMLLAAGIALALAALQTLLKDVEHGTSIILGIVFYATPILYPLTLVPAEWRAALGASPLAYLSERLREVLLASPALHVNDFIVLLACAVIFAAGLWIFRRLAPWFEDFL
jgi:ABC-type polysaccharide/polyol phosphate export permease